MNLKQCYIALFFNGSSMLGIIEADGIKGPSKNKIQSEFFLRFDFQIFRYSYIIVKNNERRGFSVRITTVPCESIFMYKFLSL